MTNTILADIEAKYPDSFIIHKHGLEAITLLKNAGADFSQLKGYEIYSIIDVLDYQVAYDNGHRAQAIQLLSDAGADFSKLNDNEIYNLLRHEFEMLPLLKAAGADFSKLDATSFYSLVRDLEPEEADALRDAGVPRHNAIDLHKVEMIKKLCKPIIEENLHKNAQVILKLETLLEETGFFLQHLDINSLEEFATIIRNSPELMESINSLYTDIDSYQIGISGKKINLAIYPRKEEGDIVNKIFPINQEGKLLYWTKVLDCEDLIEDYHFYNIFAGNQLTIMLNKHGYNFEIDPEPNYSDAEIEVLYSSVNFSGPTYGEFSNCQEYANSLSGDGIADKAIEYC